MDDGDTDSLYELVNTTHDVAGSAALVSVIAIEMIASVAINMFLMTFTLCHFRILKNPSIMFLSNFILANLILALVYMPSFILSVTLKDIIDTWEHGEKLALCQFMTFALSSYIFIATFTTTVISVDRFLFIVQATFLQAMDEDMGGNNYIDSGLDNFMDIMYPSVGGSG